MKTLSEKQELADLFHTEKPGIEEHHNTLRLTRVTRNRGQRFFQPAEQGYRGRRDSKENARGLMAKAQSRHSVWDESIESHAGRESVVV